MSGPANSREYRRQVLKELIASLHEGKSPDQVRQRFEETFQSVSAQEISEAEQALIADGMPVAEVQRLCDVHASVFKGAIADLHAPGATGTGCMAAAGTPAATAAEHPLEVFRRENRALVALTRQTIRPLLQRLQANGTPDHTPRAETVIALQAALADLGQVHLHYQRKENLIFPLLEKRGITAPPKVMWGVDDEIREKLKRVRAGLDGEEGPLAAVRLEETITQLEEMIFKEENILFPMCLENLTEEEWTLVAAESAEIGWCLIDPPANSGSAGVARDAAGAAGQPGAAVSGYAEAGEPAGIPGSSGNVLLPSGVLRPEELIGILNTLPVDITFVDKNDTVKFFSQNKDRIFARTKAIIGRSVSNCHPPASVHVVERLLEDLKAGRKDTEAFWIRMGDKFIHIRYFAVRNDAGEYLGTLEVSQDIAPIQAIEGQKRLVE